MSYEQEAGEGNPSVGIIRFNRIFMKMRRAVSEGIFSTP